MNIDILTQILTTKHEYYVVNKENKDFSNNVIDKDVILIVIPCDIKRGLKREDILLTDLEKLENSKLDCNIYLSGNYAPFQYGLTLYSVKKIHAVDCNVNMFMKRALLLNSYEYYDYVNLIEEIKKETEKK